MRGAIAAAAFVVFAAAPPARADEGESDRERVIELDLTADAMMIVGLATSADSLLVSGAAGFALGAPIVHAVNGKRTAAGISLGMRIGGPVGLGLAGRALACGGDGELGNRCVLTVVGAVVIGMVGAQLVDWIVLSGADEPGAEARLFTIGGAF